MTSASSTPTLADVSAPSYRVPARLLRALTFTTATVAITLHAHLLGGGGAAPSAVVIGVGGAVLALAYRLARHRWSARGIFPALALSQVAFHAAFSMAHTGVTSSHAAHEPVVTHASSGGSGDSRMFLAHVVATALLTWVLDQSERGLWALVTRRIRLRLKALRPIVSTLTRTPPTPSPLYGRHPGTPFGRGPPFLS